MTISQPSDLHQEFVRAFNAADSEAILALYESDAVFAPEPGQIVSGIDAIGRALSPFLASGMKMTLTTLYVMQSGNIALLSGEFVLEGGGPDLRGKTSEVARRDKEGEWRYIIDNPWSA